MKTDKEQLDKIAEHSIYAEGISYLTTIYCGRIFERYMGKGGVLELGPADGVMTQYLWSRWKDDYTAVDGAEKFVTDLKKRFPGIHAKQALFEDYKPERRFDNIILGHVLEHVKDPKKLLENGREWLAEGGKLFCAVPNSGSLHRQAAVKMGLLKTLDDFSEKDKRHGHERIFNYQSFYELFQGSGWDIKARGGYWLKPLSDGQIECDWNEELIKAYLELGEEYPEIAGEIYIIAG